MGEDDEDLIALTPDAHREISAMVRAFRASRGSPDADVPAPPKDATAVHVVILGPGQPYVPETDVGYPPSAYPYCAETGLVYPAMIQYRNPQRSCTNDKWKDSGVTCWVEEINDDGLVIGKRYVGDVVNAYRTKALVEVNLGGGSAGGGLGFPVRFTGDTISIGDLTEYVAREQYVGVNDAGDAYVYKDQPGPLLAVVVPDGWVPEAGDLAVVQIQGVICRWVARIACDVPVPSPDWETTCMTCVIDRIEFAMIDGVPSSRRVREYHPYKMRVSVGPWQASLTPDTPTDG
jgi:hypothetical protein